MNAYLIAVASLALTLIITIDMLNLLTANTVFLNVNATKTIDSKIDDTIVELVRNQTNANTTNMLTEQLIYLYRTHYDCSENVTIILEDSCDVSVTRGSDGLRIMISFPLAESYGRNAAQ
jgi:hypothetical protein